MCDVLVLSAIGLTPNWGVAHMSPHARVQWVV